MKEDGNCRDENVDIYFGWVEFEGLNKHLDTNVLLKKKYSSLKSQSEIWDGKHQFHQSDLKVFS